MTLAVRPLVRPYDPSKHANCPSCHAELMYLDTNRARNALLFKSGEVDFGSEVEDFEPDAKDQPWVICNRTGCDAINHSYEEWKAAYAPAQEDILITGRYICRDGSTTRSGTWSLKQIQTWLEMGCHGNLMLKSYVIEGAYCSASALGISRRSIPRLVDGKIVVTTEFAREHLGYLYADKAHLGNTITVDCIVDPKDEFLYVSICEPETTNERNGVYV